MVFVVTHAVLLVVAIGGHVGDIGAVATETHRQLHAHRRAPSARLGALALFVRAYSLGGGTYTGIEAVSNGVQIMREPKVRTAKRTMVLMATSLRHHRRRHHPRRTCSCTPCPTRGPRR